MTARAVAVVTTATDPGRRWGRAPRLTHYDRVLLTLTVLRTSLTERAIARLFQPATPGQDVSLLLDGTLIPVHDQTLNRPSKNYRRSVNVQVMATLDRKVVHVSDAWPGNRNDIAVAKATVTISAGVSVLTESSESWTELRISS